MLLFQMFPVPLRRDPVQFVKTNMRKTSRRTYGVKNHFGPMGIVAGHQHSAHSWGTGQTVSRITRVSGGGTHRARQAVFGKFFWGNIVDETFFSHRQPGGNFFVVSKKDLTFSTRSNFSITLFI